jgi:hypothetical protein
VVVTTGTAALVIVSANIVGLGDGHVSFAISGATTRPCTFFTSCNDTALARTGASGIPDGLAASKAHVVSLNPGTNTFTLVYRVAIASTMTFSEREITVIPF